MAFTLPRFINNQYSMIASKHYLVKPPIFDFISDEMVKRLDTVYNNRLKIIVINNLTEERIGTNIEKSFTNKKDYIYISIPSK